MFDFDDDALDALGPVSPYAGKEPVVVCWYSGGFYHEDGIKLYSEFLKAAAKSGIGDTLTLGFPDYYGYEDEGYDKWPAYVDRLVYEIDSVDEYKDRPLLLMGHSRGACPAMSLATRLGERVLKIYIVSCGAIPLGEPTPWELLARRFKESGDKGLLEWFYSLQPENVILQRISSLKAEEIPAAVSESKKIEQMVKLMRLQYKDAMFPDMCAEDPPIKAVACPLWTCWPSLDPSCTKEVMQAWSKNTTGEFNVMKFKAGHMDILANESFVKKVIEDILTFFPTVPTDE